jgi:hypothetical protein
MVRDLDTKMVNNLKQAEVNLGRRIDDGVTRLRIVESDIKTMITKV